MSDIYLLQQRLNRSREVSNRYEERSRLSPVVSTGERDPETGQRFMVQADGSIDKAVKLDNATPDKSPGWYLEGTLGFPAQISSHP